MLPFFILFTFLFTYTYAATISVQNKCSYTVWAGAVSGGGQRLDPGQTWIIKPLAGTVSARVWPRTGCSFDRSGKGKCQTGDCNGLLQCKGYGSPPNTLAEYTLNSTQDLDFFDISLLRGFNVPMEFSPTSSRCTRGVQCTADINGQCPSELRAPGGCNNPCEVFQTNQYCCTSGSCGPTNYSRFFKDMCPNAYSYPLDELDDSFTCPTGTNYKVVFCPYNVVYFSLQCNA